MWKTVQDVLLLGVAVTGAYVAYKGLSAWKKQLSGSTEYELARRLLKATYKVRDKIQDARSFVITSAEMVSALKEQGHSQDEIDLVKMKREADEAVYQRRWMRLREATSDLLVEKLESEVLWDADLAARISVLEKCVGKWIDSIEDFLSEKRNPEHADHNHTAQLKQIIYAKCKTSDEFTKEINDAVAKIEEYIKPHLQKYKD